MRVVPHTWTHHHTRRIYHVSALAVWIFLFLTAFYGSAVALWGIRAENLGLTAFVGGINPEPTVIQEGSGGGNPLPVPAVPPPDLKPEVTLNLPDNLPKRSVITPGGRRVEVVVFSTQTPAFFGQTNIPGALIFFEVHSSSVIRSTVVADNAGRWQWTPSEAVTPGLHTLYISIYNPQNSELAGKTQMEFFVELPAGQEPAKPSAPIRLPSGGFVAGAVDVVITIPNQFRSVAAGNEVTANVKLIRSQTANAPSDVAIRYIVQDKKKAVLMSVEETLSMVNQLSIIKTFTTAPNLEEGNYTIIAQVPSDTFVASSSEIFSISKLVPPLVAAGSGIPDRFFAFQMLLGLTLLFAGIGYFEYRQFTKVHNTIKQLTETDLVSV